MRPITSTVGPLTAQTVNNVILSQTRTGAGNLLVNGSLASGGVATLSTPQRLLVTDLGNNSSISYTIFGTTWAGDYAAETVAGTSSGTSVTKTDFATVTRVYSTGTVTTGVEIGTNGTGASAWIFLDPYALGTCYYQAVVSGTVNYTLQSTSDDPNSPTSPIAVPSVTWQTLIPGVVGATANTQGNFTGTPSYVRCLLNSGTGSVTLTVTQSGAVTY